MLGAANGTAESVKGAQALGSNGSVLGVVGPAGSNEVKATTGALKGAGLGFVSGSATNTRDHARRHADGLLLPHRPAGLVAEPERLARTSSTS